MTRKEFDDLLEAVRDDGGAYASSRMRLWAAIEQGDRDAGLCAYLERQSSAWQIEATHRQGQMNAFESRAEKCEELRYLAAARAGRAELIIEAMRLACPDCTRLPNVTKAIQHAEEGK